LELSVQPARARKTRGVASRRARVGIVGMGNDSKAEREGMTPREWPGPTPVVAESLRHAGMGVRDSATGIEVGRRDLRLRADRR
jgi:hypothetical protein